MLTLQELKKMTEVPQSGVGIPTAKELKKSGKAVISKKLDTDTRICVYRSGYAVYQVCGYSTVFPVHLCGDYLYMCGGNIIHLTEKFFEKEKWYLRLVLEGEDRLSHNQDVREQGISYSGISEEWSIMGDFSETVLEQLVHQEMVEEMLGLLTDKQKAVVLGYYMQGKTQMQISKELGVSRLAVRDALVHAVRRIRKKYPLKYGQDNHSADSREEKR
ncbi:sigma-70 family RNA polymerase sigma factor [Lachnospiraceae bacterium MD308]|nr:sigma-70 family RNA polymerase sigma factor [Lachnospiraceae bacterium MD308]